MMRRSPTTQSPSSFSEIFPRSPATWRLDSEDFTIRTHVCQLRWSVPRKHVQSRELCNAPRCVVRASRTLGPQTKCFCPCRFNRSGPSSLYSFHFPQHRRCRTNPAHLGCQSPSRWHSAILCSSLTIVHQETPSVVGRGKKSKKKNEKRKRKKNI